MSFLVGHIYREGNTCADRLISHGIDENGFCPWDFVPSFIPHCFVNDRQQLDHIMLNI